MTGLALAPARPIDAERQGICCSHCGQVLKPGDRPFRYIPCYLCRPEPPKPMALPRRCWPHALVAMVAEAWPWIRPLALLLLGWLLVGLFALYAPRVP